MLLPVLFLVIVCTLVGISACAPTQPIELPTPTLVAQATVQPKAAIPTNPPAAQTTLVPTSAPINTRTPEPTAIATLTPMPSPTVSPTPLPMYGVTQCGEIWQPGYYKLLNDVKSPWPGDCFPVGSHNVVFDCDGHSIEGVTDPKIIKGKQYGFYGFFVKKFNWPLLETPTNIEIKNCKISHHKVGIFVGGGNNIYIHDNDLSNNQDTTDDRRFGIFLGMTEGGGLRLDTVKGARVENVTANNGDIGIDVRDSDSIVVRNITANNNSAWGISMLNTSNSEISGSNFRDNIRLCMWGDGKTVGRGCDAGAIFLTDGASNNVVKDNKLTGDNGNGIFIKAHGKNMRCGDNNLFQNNKITGAVYNAIEFSFCSGNKVIGNDISGSFDAVFFGFSKDTEVRNNTIREMRNHGITSWNSRGSIITGNEIINSREAIYMYWANWDPKQFDWLAPSPDNYASRDNLIEANFLHDNSAAGVRLSNSTNNKVLNNTFNNNGKNVWADGKTDGTVIVGQ
jgi:parallel beta-helix repeat protein